MLLFFMAWTQEITNKSGRLHVKLQAVANGEDVDEAVRRHAARNAERNVLLF